MIKPVSHCLHCFVDLPDDGDITSTGGLVLPMKNENQNFPRLTVNGSETLERTIRDVVGVQNTVEI